ncbi:MAG TPA: FtsQ-type POTRA domain-containing protein, partial [Nannocystis exedens]|nr:FtsQ-type POTRA domain-containing protein [Nannocystis exedens]
MSFQAARRPQRRKQTRRRGAREEPGGLGDLLARVRGGEGKKGKQGKKGKKGKKGTSRVGRRHLSGNRRRKTGEARVSKVAIRRAPAGLGIGPVARRAGSFVLRFALAGGIAWGVLAGAAQGYAFVTTSPRFAAKNLLFAPTEHISPERIAELMGIDEGTNLLAVDTDELERKIAADHWVESVEVRRELPDTLRVAVVEHVPAAVLLAEHFYLIDSAGRPFKQLGRGERGDLPILTGISRELLDKREVWATALIKRGLEAMNTYQAGPARPKLGEINVGETGELTLYTAVGRTELRLGREGYAARLERYDALRAALGERAERLAVVHLDAIAGGDRSERIVASFLSPEDEAAVLGRGSAAHSGEATSRDTRKVHAETSAVSAAASG